MTPEKFADIRAPVEHHPDNPGAQRIAEQRHKPARFRDCATIGHTFSFRTSSFRSLHGAQSAGQQRAVAILPGWIHNAKRGGVPRGEHNLQD